MLTQENWENDIYFKNRSQRKKEYHRDIKKHSIMKKFETIKEDITIRSTYGLSDRSSKYRKQSGKRDKGKNRPIQNHNQGLYYSF